MIPSALFASEQGIPCGAASPVAGVVTVHDMHCWTVTSGFIAFVCHLQVAPGADAFGVVDEARALLSGRFDIQHVTVQPERAPIHDLGPLSR
jgi:Co/Zn/Cd efflux system component